MAKNTALEALRLLARSRHKAATRKVSRLKKDQGVMVSGTSVDPRGNAANISRMTTKQLRSYIAKLNTFNSRDTQFAPGASGRPLDKKLVDEYMRVQRAFNYAVQQDNARYDNEFDPVAGMTVGRRKQLMGETRDRAYGKNQAGGRWDESKRTSYAFMSEDAVKILTKDLQRRRKALASGSVMSPQRISADKMLRATGRDDLADRVAGLSNDQFNLLWRHSGFAANSSEKYLVWSREHVSDDENDSITTSDGEGQIQSAYVSWAEKFRTP